MNIGTIIKDLRLERNFTQQTVAEGTGVSRSVLSQYENNLVEPTAYVVGKFAQFFNVSADYLLGLENDYGGKDYSAAPMGEDYSAEERKIIEQYRSIPAKLKKLVREQLEIYSAPSELVSNSEKKV